jgi:hypothetical protein
VDIDVIKQQETMEYILQRNYRLVIPVNVMERLQIDSKRNDPRSSSEHMIVKLIETAVRNQKNVQIWDLNAGDVTKRAFESVTDADNTESSESEAEITVGIARRATQDLAKEKQAAATRAGAERLLPAASSQHTNSSTEAGTAESAVLLTDSQRVQSKASSFDIRTLAGSWFKQLVIDRL